MRRFPNSVRPELVEGLLFSAPHAPYRKSKDGPSTSSGRTGMVVEAGL